MQNEKTLTNDCLRVGIIHKVRTLYGGGGAYGESVRLLSLRRHSII